MTIGSKLAVASQPDIRFEVGLIGIIRHIGIENPPPNDLLFTADYPMKIGLHRALPAQGKINMLSAR